MSKLDYELDYDKLYIVIQLRLEKLHHLAISHNDMLDQPILLSLRPEKFH